MKMRASKKKAIKADIHAHIHSCRGIFKRKSGEKPFAAEWAEYKAEEKALEEAKWQRCAGR